MSDNVIGLIIIAYISLMSVLIFINIKSTNALKNRNKIRSAIYEYNFENNFPNNIYIDNSDMESFNRTIWCVWDWGYTRIIHDKFKFKRLKPYIY